MKKIINVCLILMLSIFPVTQSFAQSDDVACAAIYPCDADGYLLPEYADESGACYEYYSSQCKEEDSCDDLYGVLKILTFENQGLSQENEYLKKKLRVVRRKLRRQG